MSNYDNWLTAPLEAAYERQEAAQLQRDLDTWDETCEQCGKVVSVCGLDAAHEFGVSEHQVFDCDDEGCNNHKFLMLCDSCAAEF